MNEYELVETAFLLSRHKLGEIPIVLAMYQFQRDKNIRSFIYLWTFNHDISRWEAQKQGSYRKATSVQDLMRHYKGVQFEFVNAHTLNPDLVADSMRLEIELQDYLNPYTSSISNQSKRARELSKSFMDELGKA